MISGMYLNMQLSCLEMSYYSILYKINCCLWPWTGKANWDSLANRALFINQAKRIDISEDCGDNL